MSRFRTTVRTYGRPTSNDSASKAFDAVFDSKPSSSMATSTVHKFGKYTFTSSRAKDSEVEPKKRKVEETSDVFDDPSASTQVGMKVGQRRSRLLRSQPRTGYHQRVVLLLKVKRLRLHHPVMAELSTL